MAIVRQEQKKDVAWYWLYLDNIEKIFFHNGVLSVKTNDWKLKSFYNTNRFWICERGCVNVEKYQLREINLWEYEKIWD